MFNDLAKLLNGDLEIKIRQGILSFDPMDRECNCSLPYKVNVKCVYEGKSWEKYLIYEVKCSIFEAIYIGNTQQTTKERTGGHFYYLLRLIKNGQKSD